MVRTLVLLSALALSARSTSAQSPQQSPQPWRSSGAPESFERVEISGFVGGASVSGVLGPSFNIYMGVTSTPQNVEFGDLFGLRASWAFTEMIALEANLTRGRNRYAMDVDDFVLGEIALGEQYDVTETALTGNVLLQLPTAAGVVPYVTGGLGYLRQTPVQGPIGDEDSTSTFEFNFGGGVKYFFSGARWLGIRFDVRYSKASGGLVFSGSPSSTDLTIGAVFRFF